MQFCFELNIVKKWVQNNNILKSAFSFIINADFLIIKVRILLILYFSKFFNKIRRIFIIRIE